MPRDATEGEGVPQPAAGELAGRPLRRIPRIQPIGVERYSGSVGVRRPVDWTGRFDPILETEPISDESFLKSWGSLPEGPLTLCGTSRFNRNCRASLVTGPAPTRILVKPTVQLRLDSGRIAMTVEAELSELSGHLRQIEAQLPDGIRIVDVTAEGLTDWTRFQENRLRLMFDRPLARTRRLLRVLAWIPLADDPLEIGLREHHIRVPWIRWDGMDETAGSLTVSSISKPELLGSTGLTAVSSESTGADGTTAPRNRLTYRVDDPRNLGEIFWASPPAHVNVSIESQITIHPDSAEWVAVLRYDVVGGALDVIHLKMPVAWAAGAELRLTDSRYHLTTETRGPTAFWTITPEPHLGLPAVCTSVNPLPGRSARDRAPGDQPARQRRSRNLCGNRERDQPLSDHRELHGPGENPVRDKVPGQGVCQQRRNPRRCIPGDSKVLGSAGSFALGLRRRE